MHGLAVEFGELLKNIRPPAERMELAQNLPPKVRDFLESHNEFTTVSPHTRLAGSYGQDTAVGDVKDVDLLVRVPGNPEENEPEAKQLVQKLKKTLDELPSALGYSGYSQLPDVEVERARRSVHVYFENEDFHVDVVPCIAPNGFDDVVYVPDRGFNEWIKSNPIGLISLITELNRDHANKVRPLIKLVKHFRNVQMVYQKPKSYWLVSLVIHQVRDGLDTSVSLSELFHDFCDSVYKQYDHLLSTSDTATPNIQDPMLGHNVSWNWDRSHFETFMRRVDDARTWSKIALGTEDKSTAIQYWKKVFGNDYFPDEVNEVAKNLGEAIATGTPFVSQSGLISPNQPANGGNKPIQQTTFHGDEYY